MSRINLGLEQLPKRSADDAFQFAPGSDKAVTKAPSDRVAALKANLAGKKVDDPAALAKFIGRQRMAKSVFQDMAAKGQKESK